MNDFVSKVMKTIASIQQHIEKNGAGDVVEKHCQDHSSCQEIVEFLYDKEKREGSQKEDSKRKI